MNKVFAKSMILICGAALYFTAITYAQNGLVPYPEGFRKWAHVKSNVVEQGSKFFKKFGGINHVYANENALEGYSTGRFADGSVIVFDVFDLIEKDGNRTEGPRRFIQVMHKDSKLFPKTGGWGFEEFTGSSHIDRALTAEMAMQCFSCHAGQKERGYVFSKFRE
ncbi:MAG TPA: cytochrome P460 family protein [Pyrinomonadaceae bacterium]|jgi:hypothetical protein|nr:cytochrome P460 family protein [Pyrinomonadaceae bacterium]